jgi:hypothetical protein
VDANDIPDARCKPCQKAFEKVLYDGNVDMMINGHNHVFSRSLPIYNSEYKVISNALCDQ